jgi:ribosome maturation factor RimP
VGASPLFIWSFFTSILIGAMAFDAEQIRATAQRVAASHGLDIVELEFHGGAKHRILRVFIEKNAEERKRMAAELEAAANVGTDPKPRVPAAFDRADLDQLVGVTHSDCESFSRDFGTVLDVEDLIPGAEYTLEVSSPGLDRKLQGIEDYRRFAGMLVKVQTFEPVAGNRQWQGRLREGKSGAIRLELEGKKGSGRRAQASGKSSRRGAQISEDVEIAVSNIEKAQLVPEF